MPWPRYRRRMGVRIAAIDSTSSRDAAKRRKHLRPFPLAPTDPANGTCTDRAEATSITIASSQETKTHKLSHQLSPLTSDTSPDRSNGLNTPSHAPPARPRRPLQARLHHHLLRRPRFSDHNANCNPSSDLPRSWPREQLSRRHSRGRSLPPLPQKVLGTVNDAVPSPEPSPSHGSLHWSMER